jgi:Iap family predicted aminopeptidase
VQDFSNLLDKGMSMLTKREKNMLGIISGEEAYNNMSTLIIPINRTAGSEAEKEGAVKIKNILGSHVDKCELEGVPVTVYPERKGSLEIISPTQSIPCAASPLSGSGSGTVLLQEGGYGRKEDYGKLGNRARGAAILVTCKSLLSSLENRTSICLEARNHGAKCLIYHIEGKDDRVESAHVINVDFPAISISNKSAQELRGLISERGEIKVRFLCDLKHTGGTTYNVIGTIEGAEFPNEVIYITAHYDSWFFGANDNISSVCCLIEVAKMFKKFPPRRTIKLIAFGSEESGAEAERSTLFCFGGSWGYSKMHEKALNGYRDFIVLGIINGEFMGYSEREDAMCSAELLPIVRDAVASLNNYATAIRPLPLWTFSDHFSFHTFGIPSILFWPRLDMGTGEISPFFKLYHSNGDNMNVIRKTALSRNASLMALIAARLDSTDIPYSLDSLENACLSGIEYLPNGEKIRSYFKQKKERCLKEKARKKKLEKMVKIIKIANTNIYTLVGYGFFNKYDIILDAIAKLRDAHSILETEGDLDRSYNVLTTMPYAERYLNFSKEVTDQLDNLAENSEIFKRLPRYHLDLREIFNGFIEKESPEIILRSIQAKIEEAIEIAKEWGKIYEKALSSLYE